MSFLREGEIVYGNSGKFTFVTEKRKALFPVNQLSGSSSCKLNEFHVPAGKRADHSDESSDTTKVSYMRHNPKVALLFTDFSGQGYPPVSCTVYGKAQIEERHQDGIYREAHLGQHPDMESFIRGENIVVATVKIQRASIATIQDQVSNWTPENSNGREAES